jgi:hypothetical protein
MASPNRKIRRREITELARQTWLRIWSDRMPQDWRVYLVRNTVIQRIHGRSVCGVLLKLDKTILVGRHTKRYSFQTLVHELAHLRTGRAARPRTHLELRVQSRCAAAVRQRASNGHIILRLRSTPQRLCQWEDLSRECHAVRSCSRSRSRKQPSSRQCKRSGREVAKHGFDCAGNPVGR